MIMETSPRAAVLVAERRPAAMYSPDVQVRRELQAVCQHSLSARPLIRGLPSFSTWR